MGTIHVGSVMVGKWRSPHENKNIHIFTHIHKHEDMRTYKHPNNCILLFEEWIDIFLTFLSMNQKIRSSISFRKICNIDS